MATYCQSSLSWQRTDGRKGGREREEKIKHKNRESVTTRHVAEKKDDKGVWNKWIYSFVVFLCLQSLGDVRDGIHGGLQLLGQRQVAAGAIDELSKVGAHPLRMKPADAHNVTRWRTAFSQRAAWLIKRSCVSAHCAYTQADVDSAGWLKCCKIAKQCLWPHPPLRTPLWEELLPEAPRVSVAVDFLHLLTRLTNVFTLCACLCVCCSRLSESARGVWAIDSFLKDGINRRLNCVFNHNKRTKTKINMTRKWRVFRRWPFAQSVMCSFFFHFEIWMDCAFINRF